MTPPAGPRPPDRSPGGRSSGRSTPASRSSSTGAARSSATGARSSGGTSRTPSRASSAARATTSRAGQSRGTSTRTGAARSGQARSASRGPAKRTTIPASQAKARADAARQRKRVRPLGRSDVRLRGGLIVLVVLLVVLGGRLVQLQGVDREGYAAAAEGQRVKTTELVAHRGSITDRNGEPLAQTVDAYTVTASPRDIAKAGESCAKIAAARPGLVARLTAAGRDVPAAKPCTVEEMAAALSPIVGVSSSELAKKMQAKDDAGKPLLYRVLAKDLEPAVAKQVTDLDLAGIGREVTPRRQYPGGDLAANLTGFTFGDGLPGGGLEMTMDDVLSGTNGSSSLEVDGMGRPIPTADNKTTAAVPGKDVQLTIDRDLQWYAQQVLARKVAETQAATGSVIVLDVKTGEVMAMATAPTFNAARPADSPTENRNNPAVADIYDPGSVNKIITVSAAIEAGLVTPTTALTVPYAQKFGAKMVTDSHHHPTERYTVNGVMIQSSNVGTVQIATKLGKQRVYDAMKNFGYAAKTGVGLAGESAGLLPKPADWSGSSMGTIPIGQGVSVTALQVASVYQTVANGGVRVAPSVIKGTVDGAGRVVPAPPAQTRRVISQQTAAAMMPMLEGVVSAEGTAPLAAIPGYRIAGKTGTADRAVQVKQKDGTWRSVYDGSYTSSFVGFAPADAPRYVTAVVLQGTGKNGYYGGSTAGPVFKQVMGFALQGNNVPPTGRPFVMPKVFADGRK